VGEASRRDTLARDGELRNHAPSAQHLRRSASWTMLPAVDGGAIKTLVCGAGQPGHVPKCPLSDV
jgi:hypothetical protein